MSDFYALRGESRSTPALGAERSDADFAYLDDPEFLALYAEPVAGAPGVKRMRFYLEGAHCAACVWLVEKLPDLTAGVTGATLDLGRGVATVTSASRFAPVARELARLGYRPHPVTEESKGQELAQRENRALLIRLGVAGACAGNIMLMAVGLYAGASGGLGDLMRWLIFALFVPVLTYSARPFFGGALSAIRTRTLTIDVPIVIGVLVGSFASILNLATGSEHIYFDSISAVIFLLLSSRYLMRRAQQTALSASGLMRFLAPSETRRLDPQSGEATSVLTDMLRPGDFIEIRSGETIPADGKILKGRTHLNCALLTGEPELVPAAPGARVLAGTVNQESVIVLEVEASGAATRLGAIVQETELAARSKAPIVLQADRLARIFLWGVLTLTSGGFAWAAWTSGWQSGVEFALGMVIVTCPCALALATPLAMTVSLGRAARAGMLIKGSDVIERIARIDTIELDKTGTLTEGSISVLHWVADSTFTEAFPRIVNALESRSVHPIARALCSELGGRSTADVSDFTEILGKGVSGTIDGVRYEIRSASDARSAFGIAVYRDGATVARIRLGDRLREDATEAVAEFKRMGILPKLLTGDSAAAAHAIAAAVGIRRQDVLSGASPEIKREALEGQMRTLMAGDGANDAIALAAAGVGVAVHGGMEVSLRAADVYLQRPGVGELVNLIRLSRETLKTVRRGFVLSTIYNVGGIVGVATGHVGPLLAAVLMPISALAVIGSSIVGTRALRAIGRRR